MLSSMAQKCFIVCSPKGENKMIDQKQCKEIGRRVMLFLQEGAIKTKQPIKNVDFFLANAHNSVATARALYDLSMNKEHQKLTGHNNLNGFLWVVNASYYSMFYSARALLAHEGITLSTDHAIHSLTFDALVHFFYVNNKLHKRLLEAFAEAHEEAAEILGKEKADALMNEYFWEKGKRARLTYETGAIAIRSKAQTSLERATHFNKEIRKILEK